MVGGCTKIVQDVPPFMIADGNPAELRGPNLVGLQRRGFSESSIRTIKSAYKTLFLKKEANLAEQIAILNKSQIAQDENVRRSLDCLGSSRRGFVR
jgi:UDP-N-acetylglucosamine acyltransferase